MSVANTNAPWLFQPIRTKCNQSLVILQRERKPSAEFSKMEHPRGRRPNFSDEEIICLSREIKLRKSGAVHLAHRCPWHKPSERQRDLRLY